MHLDNFPKTFKDSQGKFCSLCFGCTVCNESWSHFNLSASDADTLDFEHGLSKDLTNSLASTETKSQTSSVKETLHEAKIERVRPNNNFGCSSEHLYVDLIPTKRANLAGSEGLSAILTSPLGGSSICTA